MKAYFWGKLLLGMFAQAARAHSPWERKVINNTKKLYNIPLLDTFLFRRKSWTVSMWHFHLPNRDSLTMGKTSMAGDWKPAFFCYRKTRNSDNVEKLNFRRIACSKQKFPPPRIPQKKSGAFPPWGGTSPPRRPSSLLLRSDFVVYEVRLQGDNDRLCSKKLRTSRQISFFSR